MTSLYLVWHEVPIAQRAAGAMVWDGDAHPLSDKMWLVRSELTRSKLYHGTQRQLPHGSALMVVPLEDRPAS
jgi:hypothetical protein